MELYKKYRSRTWDSVIGQKNVIESLRNTVKNKNLPTTMIFAGPPGTGKTTSAFLLAKSLNCPHVDENGNPCNVCETCKAIDSNSQIGIRYISMANSGSADEIRKLMQEAMLSQPIDYPIWILDEVQSISPQGWDAMLIPLEDNNIPTHFILCTTDFDKIKDTITSRGSAGIRIFNKVSNKEMNVLLAKIAVKEGWLNTKDLEHSKITPENIKKISSDANGSVRTAIGLMESFMNNTYQTSRNFVDDCLTLIIKGKIPEVFKLSQEINDANENYLKILQNLYNKIIDILTINDEFSEIESEFKNQFKPSQMISIIQNIYSGMLVMSRKSIQYRSTFEMTMLDILMKRGQK